MKSIIWYKDCKTQEEKEARKKQLESFRPAFEELSKILESKRIPPANRNYSETGWMEKQIAINEYNSALDDLLKLMKG